MISHRGVLGNLALVSCCACGAGLNSGPVPASERQSSEVRTDSLTFRARTILQSQQTEVVRTEVTATNSSDRVVSLLVPGGCPVIVQLLSSHPPNGRTVWDSQKSRSSMGCALSLVQVRIMPGESRVFVREVEKTEILGDSLPSRRYFFQAQLDLDPVPITLYAGELALSK